MKRNSFRAILPAITLLFGAAMAAAVVEETVPLFDGKTLTGWTLANGKPIETGWEVAEGTIHRKEKIGDIVTEKAYENFVLEFEFKAAPGTNSGLKYRWGRYGKQNIGLEYQVIADKNPLDKPTKHTTAALYDLIVPGVPKNPRPATEWNTGKVVANGNTIEHYLNGEKVVAVTLGSPEWSEILAKSKFKANADFGTKKGKILLQEHGGEVWFRNIKITELPPTPASAVEKK
jgi:hypothetical protein